MAAFFLPVTKFFAQVQSLNANPNIVVIALLLLPQRKNSWRELKNFLISTTT
jgi:hypothetical protein